jgi:hypothetical protein
VFRLRPAHGAARAGRRSRSPIRVVMLARRERMDHQIAA